VSDVARAALIVAAPMAGTVTPLERVPDPVFAGAIVGPGLALDPDPDATEATTPIGGVLLKVKPHAFVIADDAGRAVLVHLGIDTVKLGGDGFEVVAAEGSRVAAGTPVIRWDPDAVRRAGLSAVCPVIALEAAPDAVAAPASGHLTGGQPLYTWA